MKVIVVPPDAPPYTDIVEDGNHLEGLQKLVGGYIETVQLHGGDHAIGVINEEGKIHDLPPNPLATSQSNLFPGDYIAGTMVVVGGYDPSGEFTDVTSTALNFFAVPS